MKDDKQGRLEYLSEKLVRKDANLTATAKLIDLILDTEHGRKLFGQAVGLELTGHPELTNRALVALCVPSYKSLHPKMMTATNRMLAYSKQFCDIAQAPTLGSSVVHWARNQLIASVIKAGQPWTHILFLDDDIVVPEDFLVRLLRHEKDVVGAICTRRTDPPLPNARDFIEETQAFVQLYHWEPDKLIEVGGIGTGALLLSRKVVEAVGDYYLDCVYERDILKSDPEWVKSSSETRRAMYEDTKDAFWFNFQNHPHGRGEYGEDIGFCWKARQCGFKIYADTSVKPGHIGDYEYSTDDYLPFKEQEMAKAVKQGKIIVEREPVVEVVD